MSVNIVFSNPSKTYLPGDYVSGKVLLTTKDPISARYMEITWKGESKCNFGGSESSNVQRHLAGTFMGWIAKDGVDTIPAGTLKSRFRFRLPENSPPSFCGMFGEIEYSVTVEFDRPWRLKLKMMNTFRVVQKTNLTLSEPKMMKYAEFVKSKNSGTIFKDGLFLLKLHFSKRAFLAGETIRALAIMENHSTKPIINLRFELIQQSHYHSRPQKSLCSLNDCHSDCPIESKYRRDGETVLRGANYSCDVAPGEVKYINVEIDLPNGLPPTFESPMISMGYLLGFTLRNGSLTGNRLACNARIVVGSEETIDEMVDECEPTKKSQCLTASPPPYHP